MTKNEACKLWPAALVAALCLLFCGCDQRAKQDPCDKVSCCGHGECAAVDGKPVCSCQAGFNVSADGRRCVPDDAGACAGISCSGHGCCQVSDGKPTCNCDPGYRLDPNDTSNLTCMQDRCLWVGETCKDSSECCENDCLKYTGQETGYCTRRDCINSDDCVNYSKDGKQMCCIDAGGEYFLCMKLGKGCFCGDQKGTCGHSCTCQNDSACTPSFSCLRGSDEDTGAICTRACVSDSDCQECHDDVDTDITFTCQPIFGGDTYCLPAEQQTCNWSGDCQGNDVCIAYPTADEMSLEGRCNRLGDLPPGSACDDAANPNNLPFEERCSDFYCMHGACSEVCQFDADCPENMFCGLARFRTGASGTSTASINMCQGGTFCSSGADCEGDDVCQVAQISDYDLVGMCGHFDGQLDIGAECDDNADPNEVPPGEACVGFYCIFGHCTEVCAEDRDCPGDGGRCCSVNFGGMGPTGDDTASVGLCRWTPGSGTVCRGDSDCLAHETCQYCVKEGQSVDKFCTAENCDLGKPGCDPPGTLGCGDEGASPCWGGLCLVSLSQSFCSSLCDSNADCPSGMACGALRVSDTQTTGACIPN